MSDNADKVYIYTDKFNLLIVCYKINYIYKFNVQVLVYFYKFVCVLRILLLLLLLLLFIFIFIVYFVHKQYNKLMNVNYHAHLMTTFYVNALQLHCN